MSLRVAFSVDVEEEGLFSGRYSAVAEGVNNVVFLRRLEFVTREFGVPLTLLCTWPVFHAAAASSELLRWRDEFGAEIGLHLHPWNTPPLGDPNSQAWTPSEDMDSNMLQSKLAELVRSCREATGVSPTTFRMGRFDLGRKVRGLLPSHGIRVDSSFVPMTWAPALPEAFLSQADPYILSGTAAGLTEVPLTMVPLSVLLGRLASAVGAPWLLRRFQMFGAVGLMPSWYPLVSMKLAARLHLARGGQVLHLFLHSSELMPGCAPHVPDEHSIGRMIGKIQAFMRWLQEWSAFTGVTLSELDMARPAQDSK